MTAAVARRGTPRIRLHALPEYEPDGAPEPGPLRRWSSLRPATGPQLVVPPPGGPTLPPATLWRVLNQVLEVLDGRRPVGQVHALLPDAAYEAVLTRLRSGPRARHRLRRLRTCYPAEGAVEIAAVIDVTTSQAMPARVIALAARFEDYTDDWRCTHLRLL